MSAASIDVRTAEALDAGGYGDPRPVYRSVMRRLRERDAAAFDEATRRYEETLVPALTDDGTEPVAAWAEYGAWLARRLGPGRLVQLDASGLASEASPEPVPGQVLLYLPDEAREPAIPILRPTDPSLAQQASLELLAR